MGGQDRQAPTDRRRQLINRLVQQYQSAAEPDRWLEAMTLKALRALDRANLSPAEKSPARREIHSIHREVASMARAMQLTRRSPPAALPPAPGLATNENGTASAA
ncbi:MAG: hypothetical protein KDK07_20930 [Bauldia sp.]|nr:hypothetical protein [Bauldia sp.]